MHTPSSRPSRLSLCLVLIAGLAPAPGAWAAQTARPGLEGHWEGAILVREGEIEAEMTADLSRGPDKALGGTVTVPLQNVQNRPFESVVQQDDVVSLVFRDGEELSIFNGTLSPDGSTIEGNLTEGGHSFRFVLRRQAASGETPRAKPADLQPLSAGLSELKQRFSADAGHARLLLVLEPSQQGSLMAARLIRRYVLDPIQDERLRIYVVWVATAEGDSEAAARTASTNLADPRVTQFYAADPAVSKAFQAPLDFKEPLVREVALAYSADQAWGEAFPAPRVFMHRSRAMPQEHRLNAIKLADSLKELLGPAVK